MDLWMARTDCLDDGEMSYNPSTKIGSKRANEWFIDNAEAGLFPNKRQAAAGILYHNSAQEVGSANGSVWENASDVQSDCLQHSGRIYGSDASRDIHAKEGNIPSSRTESINVHSGRKLIEDTFGMGSSFNLSMSHAIEDLQPGYDYDGFRKVKAGEVKDCDNESIMAGDPYDSGCKGEIFLPPYSKKNDAIMSTGLSYTGGNSHMFTVGSSGSREGSSFMLMNLQYKERGGFPIHGAYNVDDNSVLAADEHKGSNNVLSSNPKFIKSNLAGPFAGVDYKRGANIFPAAEASLSLSNAHSSTLSLDHSCTKYDANNLSMGQKHSGENNIISFGNFHDDEANFSGRNISNYDLFIDQVKQPSVRKAEVPNQMNLNVLDRDANTTARQEIASVNECVSKNHDQQKNAKKMPQNNFPSNVRSLLSTGMLDGVPVKYIAWSREKELRAVIKGSGYLCGCEACNFLKVINAYEFERHAQCKTKHPNNHIYFENGKTIYGIVQELRSTPQDLLFEVIQTITGSPLNQKSFRAWKESFLAATRELQRIYGANE